MPEPSSPRTCGCRRAHSPFTMWRSLWQTPAAAMRTRTWPGPGSARRRRSNWRLSPPFQTAAVIVGIPLPGRVRRAYGHLRPAGGSRGRCRPPPAAPRPRTPRRGRRRRGCSRPRAGTCSACRSPARPSARARPSRRTGPAPGSSGTGRCRRPGTGRRPLAPPRGSSR